MISIFMVLSVAPQNSEWMSKVIARMAKTYPDYHETITPEVSVKKQLKIIEECTMEDTGSFLSIRGH